MDFNLLLPKDLYHSYVVVGYRDDTVLELENYFKNKKENFEIMVKIYDAFTVEDSSEIKEWHSIRSNNNERKICILAFHFINHDAERTLLKMLEEPKDNTHFFLIVPNEKLLLDTILSRTHVIRNNILVNDEIKYNNAVDFIRSPIPIRLEIIAEMIKNCKDTEGSGKLRNEAIVLVNMIEDCLYKNWRNDKKDENSIMVFDVLQKSRKYLSIPGASVKMILEQIAFVI